MKKCNKCQAEMPDEAAFCPNCGAEQNAETAEAAETVETAEAAPAEQPETKAAAPEAEPPKKKSYTRVIVAAVACVLVIGILLAALLLPKKSAKDNQNQASQTSVDTTPEDASQEDASLEDASQEDVEETPSVEISADNAHHINAYGYPSYSVHFAAAEDGSYTFSYLDETGASISVDEADVLAAADQVVATCGGMELTNRDLMYYYDQQFYTFYSYYYYYISYFMNMSMCLDEQLSLDGEQTWQGAFLIMSLESFQQTAALYLDAMANGFTLDEETQATLDNLEADLTEFAMQYGFADAQDYLEDYFGPTATVESYLEYIRVGQIASSYAEALEDLLEVSEEDLSDYYDENEETITSTYHAYKIDKNVVNVRHILIVPEDTESEDSWAEAEAEAQRIYEEWQAGEATEDSFAELANTYSADTGSNTNGGLYEDVYPGQMVDAFNDWCFEDGRAVGDTGIVKTDYGYHIMFFSGEGDYIFWRDLADSMVRSELSAQQRSDIAAQYEAASDLSCVLLMDSLAPSAPTSEDDSEEAELPVEPIETVKS